MIDIAAPEPPAIATFATPDASPADILTSASAVSRFFYEIAPHLRSEMGGCGLSEKGAYGMMLIFEALERSIDAAVDRI